MSDLLIKNMEMPKNCEDCFACQECSYESFDYCNVLKAMTTRGERRKDCPLVTLPEHGRLGDLDKLQKKVEDCAFVPEQSKTMYMMAVEKEIRDAPTIVEANNGTDN